MFVIFFWCYLLYKVDLQNDTRQNADFHFVTIAY
jgi:hypothetical protein